VYMVSALSLVRSHYSLLETICGFKVMCVY